MDNSHDKGQVNKINCFPDTDLNSNSIIQFNSVLGSDMSEYWKERNPCLLIKDPIVPRNTVLAIYNNLQPDMDGSTIRLNSIDQAQQKRKALEERNQSTQEWKRMLAAKDGDVAMIERELANRINKIKIDCIDLD
eukprot:11272019-Ditylum_brightwellii.AAC.1